MTVVVGYVPNPFGEAALDAGIEEARRRNARLVVVNTSKGDALVDQKFASDDQLAAVRTRLDGIDVETEVQQSSASVDVAEGVLAVVAAESAEVLVIGIRRRTPVGKMLMGSVAQRLLLDAPCAILAVKTPA